VIVVGFNSAAPSTLLLLQRVEDVVEAPVLRLDRQSVGVDPARQRLERRGVEAARPPLAVPGSW
jgi:hypothetical protein